MFEEKTVSPVLNIQAQAFVEETTPPLPSPQVADKTITALDLIHQRSVSALLDVPVVRQLPELYNGCEVTSLAMLLAAEGQSIDKMELANKLKKDPTPFKGSSLKQIHEWGNPNEGFVGDITGKQKGYGVYNGPLFELLQQYVSKGAVNLTGKDFAALEWVLSEGSPVVVWTTVSFKPTNRWVTWKNQDIPIEATFQLHAVLLVGYDEQFVYINDPLTGSKGQKINKAQFIESWKQLGSQAITIVEHQNAYVLNQ